ncbi:MAG: enoyl-CoA hydratase/isomerase family protein [Elusimicrobia bacterium]|nr:enoyl-CoA hydratase/isomerase family protein [Elusimicrobiota bacterium]
MTYEILKTEEADAVLTVTMDRPKAMNALNTRFFQEMDDLVASVGARSDLRALVLTGAGKAFVAGADIAEMVGMDSEAGSKFSAMGQKTFRGLEECPLPVIAAVNGYVLGGGCELAMSCDFRVASTAAKFGQPEVNLGLTPGYAGTQRLARLVGAGNALFLLLTGEMISAEEALRMGLVQKVVPPESLMPEALGLAKKIASKGPKAVRAVKRLVRQGLLTSFDAGCALESMEFGALFGDEGAEGMKAFLEKRPAKWN